VTHALALRDIALITDGKRLCRRRRRRRCGEGAGGEGAPSSMSARDLPPAMREAWIARAS